MEGMERSGIEKVFRIYKFLYDKLNQLSDVIETLDTTEAELIQNLQPVFEAMQKQLTKYYDTTALPSIYSDGVT
jgi:hypothetical protein